MHTAPAWNFSHFLRMLGALPRYATVTAQKAGEMGKNLSIGEDSKSSRGGVPKLQMSDPCHGLAWSNVS